MINSLNGKIINPPAIVSIKLKAIDDKKALLALSLLPAPTFCPTNVAKTVPIPITGNNKIELILPPIETGAKILSTVRLWLLRIPVLLAMVYLLDFDYQAVWLCMVISNFGATILGLLLYQRVDYEPRISNIHRKIRQELKA